MIRRSLLEAVPVLKGGVRPRLMSSKTSMAVNQTEHKVETPKKETSLLVERLDTERWTTYAAYTSASDEAKKVHSETLKAYGRLEEAKARYDEAKPLNVEANARSKKAKDRCKEAQTRYKEAKARHNKKIDRIGAGLFTVFGVLATVAVRSCF